jgi:hypothetical protein
MTTVEKLWEFIRVGNYATRPNTRDESPKNTGIAFYFE